MQTRANLLRVIFMLSTIVAVADCCSSRILLLREHTLNIVNEQRFVQQQHDRINGDDRHAHQLHHHQQQQQLQQQQAQDKIPQHVDILTHALDFNHNFSDFVSRRSQDESTTSSGGEILPPSQPSDQQPTQPPDHRHSTTDKSAEEAQASSAASLTIEEEEVVNASASGAGGDDFITDPTVRERHSGNPKYHVIDFYYTIMRDVLSFQCQGQFLTDFCLNGGRCFRYPVGNHSFLSCECADGYVGERCESKSLNELYIPAAPTSDLDGQQPKILMARIVFSFPMLIAISVIYIIFGAIIVLRCPHKKSHREQPSVCSWTDDALSNGPVHGIRQT